MNHTKEKKTKSQLIYRSSKGWIEFDPEKKEYNGLVTGLNFSEQGLKEEQIKNFIINDYQQYINKFDGRIIILAGAGTSISEGGLTMQGLWDTVSKDIGEKFEQVLDKTNYKEKYKEKNDLEALLSSIDNLLEIKEDQDVINTKDSILKIIKDKCTLKAKNNNHEILIKRLANSQTNNCRPSIFTTNYDLLFEKAAGKSGIILIDGFSFTYPRRFDGSYFDYDIVKRDNSRIREEQNFVKDLIYFYKLHGSLSWNRNNEHIEQANNPDNPVLIYPRSSKFSDTYEQPFFEMMSRFQKILRERNILLITVGFSFADKHIRNVIHESLNKNASMKLLVVDYNIDGEGFGFIDKCDQEQVMSIKSKFEDFVKNYPYQKYRLSEVTEKDE